MAASMSRPRFLQSLLLAVFGLLLAGCANIREYHSDSKHCEKVSAVEVEREVYRWGSLSGATGSCDAAWQVDVEKPNRFSMNFVEIDEQGVLVDRKQAEDAIHTASAGLIGARPSYVVVFVHGWHHNAAVDDANVRGFYNALNAISRWNPNIDVKGIYIGWRGDSLTVPGLRYATFWDRKNTSDEVGRGGLLEFLLRLERGVKPDPASNNRLVLVGHSFGASVTFNSLAHVYMQRFLDGVFSTAQAPRFRGYGDLVVLINPAIEAMRYMPFQSAIEYYSSADSPVRLDFSHEKRPYLVVLSSEADWATHYAFPFARFFSTALEAHDKVSANGQPDEKNGYSEWVMDRDTVGNFERFQTHRMIEPDAAAPHAAPQAQHAENADEPTSDRCRMPPAADVKALLRNDHEPVVFADSRLVVTPNPKAIQGSPYIVAAISKKIVGSHNDIGQTSLLCWVNQLINPQADP